MGLSGDSFPWREIQRRSILHARPTRLGIRIVLDTKDDREYSHYVFEVFLTRGAATATRGTRPRE